MGTEGGWGIDWLLGSGDGLRGFLCLLGTRKRSFWGKELTGRRAEFVVLEVNMWFSSCKVARIKCNILACVQEAILYVCVSQLWHELLGCFLYDVSCVWLSVGQ
jgi:hypothetical protein